MNKNLAQKGFTLIELLIVIVIIGILAGIVMVILNPAKQMARARDSVLVATMNKVSAEAQAFANSDITGVGTFPTCAQIAGTTGSCTGGTLSNVSTCACGAASPAASFGIGGIYAPAHASAVTTAATTPAEFRYVPTANTAFCVSARSNVNNITGGNNFLKYNYPADSGPSYQTTGC